MTNINQYAGNFTVSSGTCTGTSIIANSGSSLAVNGVYLKWARPSIDYLKAVMESGSPIIKIVTENNEACSIEILTVDMFESTNNFCEYVFEIPDDFDFNSESLLDLSIALLSNPNSCQDPFVRIADMSREMDQLIQVVYTIDDKEHTIALGDLIKLITG